MTLKVGARVRVKNYGGSSGSPYNGKSGTVKECPSLPFAAAIVLDDMSATCSDYFLINADEWEPLK